MYTAVVIFPEDREHLRNIFTDRIPPWWDMISHHMTINMGAADEGPCAGRLGEKVELLVKSFAMNDRVAAVKVETSVPSTNQIKHVTIAIDRSNGGKPVQSNKLEEWTAIPEFRLRGEIQEVK